MITWKIGEQVKHKTCNPCYPGHDLGLVVNKTNTIIISNPPLFTSLHFPAWQYTHGSLPANSLSWHAIIIIGHSLFIPGWPANLPIDTVGSWQHIIPVMTTQQRSEMKFTINNDDGNRANQPWALPSQSSENYTRTPTKWTFHKIHTWEIKTIGCMWFWSNCYLSVKWQNNVLGLHSWKLQINKTSNKSHPKVVW